VKKAGGGESTVGRGVFRTESGDVCKGKKKKKGLKGVMSMGPRGGGEKRDTVGSPVGSGGNRGGGGNGRRANVPVEGLFQWRQARGEKKKEEGVARP